MLKKAMIIGLMALGFSSIGSAAISAPLWDCSLQSTTLKGWTGAIGLALSHVHGEGVVHCQSLIGPDEMDTPVVVSLIGVGGGLGYSRIDAINFYIASVGVATPNDLYGNYKFQGNVSAMIFNRGADANTFVAVSDLGLSVGVGVSGYRGRGLDVAAEVQGLSIRPIAESESAY